MTKINEGYGESCVYSFNKQLTPIAVKNNNAQDVARRVHPKYDTKLQEKRTTICKRSQKFLSKELLPRLQKIAKYSPLILETFELQFS